MLKCENAITIQMASDSESPTYLWMAVFDMGVHFYFWLDFVGAQVTLDALEKFFFGDDFWMVLLGWVDGLGVDRRGNAPHVLFHSVGYGKSESQNSEYGTLSCASNDSYLPFNWP